MSGRLSRNKGRRFEQEVARLLRTKWPEARRGLSQTRAGAECCDVEGTPYFIECKRYKKCTPGVIAKARAQGEKATDGRPVVVVFKSDGPGPVSVEYTAWAADPDKGPVKFYIARPLEEWLRCVA